MTGTVAQINISRGGIPKYPIREGCVTPLGIEGDACAHPRFHGGPRQALLLICAEAIEIFIGKGYPLFFGALGENITTRGIDPRQLRIGQRFRLGEVVVELTKVRVPCSALHVYGNSIKQDLYNRQVKAGDPASPLWGLSGLYASIVRTGIIRQDDIITLIEQVV